MYSQMVGCSSNSTLPALVENVHPPLGCCATCSSSMRVNPMARTQYRAASASHHISSYWIFCCSKGPKVCVHVKLDYCLQFVHPSVMVPVSWKLTEDVNWLLYLQRRGCWSSFGMQHALGRETFSHFRRICWQYLIRPPSAIVTVIHCQIRYPKQKTQNLFHFNRIHLKRGWWSNPSVDKRND